MNPRFEITKLLGKAEIKKSKEISSLLRLAKEHYEKGTITVDPVVISSQSLITTQSASMEKDEKSRRKADKGEKPTPNQYLVIMELNIRPTSEDDDEERHRFGRFVSVGSAWCPCKSGSAKCVHKGMALRYQIRFWAPDSLGDESVVTDARSRWKHRGAKKCIIQFLTRMTWCSLMNTANHPSFSPFTVH